jgi:hypothetical protein
MMIYFLILLAAISHIMNPQTALAQTPDPQALIDACIEAHGGKRFTASMVDFDFRGRHFTVEHRGGLFSYVRAYSDSAGDVRETLDNEGARREVNGAPVEMPEKTAMAVGSVINSVVYFAMLPHKLNDTATRKRYLGASVIKGEPYHRVEVTFAEEGGGEDYRDVFIYWIHRQRHTMDYLAYKYHVDGGGTRFREAVNVRIIEGIRLTDYYNYRAASEDILLEGYEHLFLSGELIKASDVNLENPRVRLIENP